jgi:rare lipoprotein A
MLSLLSITTAEAESHKEEVKFGYSYKQDERGINRFNRKPTVCGKASWYGKRHSGRKTASGERFDPRKFTAASWNYRFGTRVEVFNPKNGRAVIVRINDRGPARRLKRLIDLSERSFQQIDKLGKGIIRVCVRVLGN